MLKLGVVTRRGVRRPRTLLGRRRYVSFLLLPELAHDPQTHADEYDRLAGHACMPNGVWKLTQHGRLRVLDKVVLDALRTRYAPGTQLTVCDLAASMGATSVELFHLLRERFSVHFTASDLYRDLIAVRSRRWPAALIFDGCGQEVQYICGPFVLPNAPAESIAYPVNRFLKVMMRRFFAPRARSLLHNVDVKRVRPFETLDAGGYEITRLPMLTRETLEVIAAHDGFTFEEWNILEPLPQRAHVVRAMNILTPEHFSDEQRARAVRNCVQALLPGGIFVVGSSPSPDPDSVKASIYVRENDHVVRVGSLNDGSDIDDLIAAVYGAGEMSTAVASSA